MTHFEYDARHRLIRIEPPERGTHLWRHGERIPDFAAEAIKGVAKVLNIAWVEDALSNPARIICPRSTHSARRTRASWSCLPRKATCSSARSQPPDARLVR